MKFQVCAFVVLCFLTTTLAGSLSVHVRTKRAVSCSTDPNAVSAALPTHLPWSGCPSGPTGLFGLVQAMLYLVQNILSNIGFIHTTCAGLPNGPNILKLLVNLILQLIVLVAGLPGCSTNAAMVIQMNLCISLMGDILATLGLIVTPTTATNWACTCPPGAAGDVITLLISTVVNLIVGLGTLAMIGGVALWIMYSRELVFRVKGVTPPEILLCESKASHFGSHFLPQ